MTFSETTQTRDMANVSMTRVVREPEPPEPQPAPDPPQDIPSTSRDATIEHTGADPPPEE